MPKQSENELAINNWFSSTDSLIYVLKLGTWSPIGSS